MLHKTVHNQIFTKELHWISLHFNSFFYLKLLVELLDYYENAIKLPIAEIEQATRIGFHILIW